MVNLGLADFVLEKENSFLENAEYIHYDLEDEHLEGRVTIHWRVPLYLSVYLWR